MAYLKSKNVKMRSVDVETNQHIDLSDDDDDESEESKGGRRKTAGRGGNKE